MNLITEVRWNFPGLETQEKLSEHKTTVLKFMNKRQAVCVKEEAEIAGVILFSREHNMICCLAVAPQYRRCGVATMLMDEALANLDKTKEITVSTFRADDEKGIAPRTLYEKFGFVADELIEEFDYPNQKFVLFPVGSERKARQISINSMVWEISHILADCDPTIYLYGSSALNDFRLGWSDIDILVLTEKQISESQANLLVNLRQLCSWGSPIIFITALLKVVCSLAVPFSQTLMTGWFIGAQAESELPTGICLIAFARQN